VTPLAVLTHPACLGHDAGRGHPESPARLDAVLDRLAGSSSARLVEAEPLPDLALLDGIHDQRYLERLQQLAASGGGALDPDTVMVPATWPALLAACGAVAGACTTALAEGEDFAAVRPPGHHALFDRAMGFCFVAGAVLAARRLQAAGRERVLIVDWDVHHGNGTQALVESDPTIRFLSMHQHPWWPGSGLESERGVGNIFNLPRAAGLAPARYVADLLEAVARATDAWVPDALVISAGFDSMAGDPLGGFTLGPGHYAELVAGLRRRVPGVPTVSLLEGGYAPRRVAQAAAAHVEALAG